MGGGRRSPAGPSRKKSVSGPGASRAAGSPSSLAGRPAAGGRAGQGVDAPERAAAQPSPEARRPDPASAPAAAGKERTGGRGRGRRGHTRGRRHRRREGSGMRGHGRGGRASELPTPPAEVLRAEPLQPSPRGFSQVPTPMFSPTFLYYPGFQEASLWETPSPNLCVLQSPGAGRTCQKRKEGRHWKHGSGRPNLREKVEVGASGAPLSPPESDRHPSQASTHCHTVRPPRHGTRVLSSLTDKAPPSSPGVLYPHFRGRGGTTRNGSHCPWAVPEVSAAWSHGPARGLHIEVSNSHICRPPLHTGY